MKNARPAKLRDGTWGARVEGDVDVGDELRVTTAAGKSWPARVARVLWRGDGAALVATESLDRAGASSASGGVCDECGRSARRLIPCVDSSGIGGSCCPRCAARPRYERSFA